MFYAINLTQNITLDCIKSFITYPWTKGNTTVSLVYENLNPYKFWRVLYSIEVWTWPPQISSFCLQYPLKIFLYLLKDKINEHF